MRITKFRSDKATSLSREKYERWIYVALMAMIGLAPLPFGSNRPLPIALLGCGLGGLTLVWACLAGTSRITPRPVNANTKWPILLYATVCAWTIVQWTPWTPQTFSDPIWSNASNLIGTQLRGRITVNPEATLTGLLHLLIYGSVFWLSFQLTHRSERAWNAIQIITIIGSIYSLYGIIVFITGNGWILFYPKWTYLDSLTSTFVNRNSFATFAGLCLLCSVSVLLKHLEPFFSLKHPPRAKAAPLIEEIATRGVWKSLALLLIATALLLSASRGGVASTMFGLVFLLSVYIFRKRRKWRHTFVILGITSSLILIIFSASGNHISQRLILDQIDANFDGRSSIYAITWEAIKTSPWMGTGFGTFPDVFPAYRETVKGSPITWDKAHNTYLENALELGIPAALALNLSIFLLAFQSALGILERKRDKILPALGVATTLLVGLHSLVDFSLQIPAVTILYACIMGISFGQSRSRQRNHFSEASQKFSPSPTGQSISDHPIP